MNIVSWFSAGISSAIATKLAIIKYPDMPIVYIDIDDMHMDSMRFISDCEKWYGKEIQILKSKYNNVDNVCRTFGYVNGPGGARCTTTLKKRVRKEWERENNPTHYIWGFDCSKREVKRADRIKETMPEFEHIFPLIEKGITKEIAHGILKEAKIERPEMYKLGYPNNNCIGCLKGGKGYWNKIRIDFPDVFENRAKMERVVGHSCIKGIFLDELDPSSGNILKPIIEKCGVFCMEAK